MNPPQRERMNSKNAVIRENKEKEGEFAIPDPEEELSSDISCSDSVLPSMDRLREELSCPICLEICFEPTTTTCAHNFCNKCLNSAVHSCGNKCPKCRQPISHGRSFTVNTAFWNVIQILFPEEVKARKAAVVLNNREITRQSPREGIDVLSTRESRNRDVSTRRVLGSSLQSDTYATLRLNFQAFSMEDFLALVELRHAELLAALQISSASEVAD